MSKTNKKTKKYATEEALTSLNDAAWKSEMFFEKYAKQIGVIIGIVILASLAYVMYQNFIIAPKNEEAADALVDAQNLYNEGKTEEALGGKGSGLTGFADIADQYGSTKTGKLAALYAGSIEYKKGNFQKALDYFQQFDSPDKDLKTIKYGAMADAYVELNNNDEALKYMEKAAKTSKNGTTVFQFAKKAGILAMTMNQNEKALEMFKYIKDNYPDADQTGEVDAYIERLTYATQK